MGNIIGESYYYFKYFARNKIKAKNDASDWVYEHYVKQPFWDTDTANRKVAEMIAEGSPFMMGRFGSVELFNMRVDEFHQSSKTDKACEQLSTCAGFFRQDFTYFLRPYP